VQLTFLTFNYEKKNPTYIRVPSFENKCLKGHYVPLQRGPWTAGHVHGDMFNIHDTRLYGVTTQSVHNAS